MNVVLDTPDRVFPDRHNHYVERIRERSPEILQENFQLTSQKLERFANQQEHNQPFSLRRMVKTFTRENSLQRKEHEFQQYFEMNVFNRVIHTTLVDLGDEVELQSPELLGSSVRSGNLDKEIGNTNYVFASADNLRSNSSYYPVEYEIESRDCHVVPLDLAHQPNYPGGESVMLGVYGRNIYNYSDFKRIFSKYCAVVFESPEEALLFFKDKSFYTRRADAWEDESIELNSISPNEKKAFKKMQELYLKEGIVPPFSPEFQFKDKVKGRKVKF